MAMVETGLYSRGTCVRRRAAAAGPERGDAERNEYRDPAHPHDPPQPADHLGGDGHRHRGEARHRHGAGGRHRRHPPQSSSPPIRPRRCARSSASRAAWSSIRSPSFPTRRWPTRSPSCGAPRSPAFPWSSAHGKPAKLVGILTNRDVRFADDPRQPVTELMTRKVVTVGEGVSHDEARRLLHQHRIEKLVVVDDPHAASASSPSRTSRRRPPIRTPPRTPTGACASPPPPPSATRASSAPKC